MPRPPTAPQCPYCGSIAPHGEPRVQWIAKHLDRRRHRFWWWLKKAMDN